MTGARGSSTPSRGARRFVDRGAAVLMDGVVATATVIAAIALMHLLVALAPGDPIDLLPNAPEVRGTLEARWGLDRTVPQRIADTLVGIVTGDMGTSLSVRPGAPVHDLVARPLLRSLGWWTAGAVLCVAASLALAVPTRARSARGIVGAVSLIPVFLLAHLLVRALNWLALLGGDRPAWFPLPLEPSTVRWLVAVSVLAIGSASLSDGTRDLATAAARVRGSLFFAAARSRGESELRLLTRHLVLAVADLVATRAPVWLGSLVVLEHVLLLDGAGRTLWRAAEQRDVPVAIAITAAFATWVAAVRWGAAILRATADPRPRSAA